MSTAPRATATITISSTTGPDVGVDGLVNLVRGMLRGVRGLARRLSGRREPPPAL